MASRVPVSFAALLMRVAYSDLCGYMPSRLSRVSCRYLRKYLLMGANLPTSQGCIAWEHLEGRLINSMSRARPAHKTLAIRCCLKRVLQNFGCTT
jgi:hypothetical protein